MNFTLKKGPNFNSMKKNIRVQIKSKFKELATLILLLDKDLLLFTKHPWVMKRPISTQITGFHHLMLEQKCYDFHAK